MFTSLFSFVRVWIVLTLTVLLVPLGMEYFGVPIADAQPFVTRVEQACQPLRATTGEEAALKGARFDFFDHELAYAGGYSLRPLSAVVRGLDFDVIDHELARAGNYGLQAAAPVARGADFGFIDHELAHAGGYTLRPFSGFVRGPDFYFIDHELAHGGSYRFCTARLRIR